MHAVHLLGGASRGAVGRSAKRAGGRAFQSILRHDDAHCLGLGFRNSRQKRRSYRACQRQTRFHRSTSVIATSPPPSYRRDGRDDGIAPRRCLGSSSSSSSTGDASANGSNDNADATTTTSSRWTRVLLPTIGQNGTLVIRSNDNSVAQVQIVSQWRDDALLEVFPMQNNNRDDDDADAERRRCAGSNADGEDSEIIDIFEHDDKASESSTTTQQTFGRLQLTSHAEGISTSMGRKGSLVEVDIILPTTPHQSQSNTNSDTDNKPMLKIIATVPEKCNITCHLSHDGDIDIPGKLEGDIHLATCNGNITVSKLRGHNVTLDTTSKANESMMANDRNDAIDNSSRGVIHVRKAIEAGTVKINTSSRVRARMLNGSNVSVNVTPPDAAQPIATTTTSSPKEQSEAPKTFVKLDDDDEGAVIDVGSLYVSNGSADGSSPGNNEARLEVHGGCNFIASRGDDRAGLVRVKSSHGHVTVRAETNGRIIMPDSSPRKSSLDDERIMMAPLVDLGGVNGSCDINLEPHFTENGTSVIGCNDSMAARVHFDSMTPESISTITSRGRVGNASITMDRKLEADIRLLSVANSRAMLPADVDAYALTSDEAEDVRSALLDVDAYVVKESAASSEKVGDGEEAIAIETDAYRGERGLNALSSNGESEEENYEGTMLSPDIEYAQGTMKNRSGEPDSRFDVRSRGKINIAGAASQALHGFQGKEKENDPSSSSAPPMPLLAVATDGKIKLETLSWFGSIARRYGLEEEEGGGGGGLGRQASRAPRLDK